MANKQKNQQLKFNTSDDELRGNYSNLMQIRHNKSEFVLDFFLAIPPRGELVSRVITSPAHAKRVAKALQQNIKAYEEKFGKIEEAKGPKSNIGFAKNQ